MANKHLEQNTTAIPGGSEWTFENIRSEMVSKINNTYFKNLATRNVYFEDYVM